jgi:type III secretion protein J
MRLWPHARVLGFVALVASTSACDSPREIVHGMTELEANEILVVLEDQGISGDKTMEEGRIVTWKVAVPTSRSRDALKVLVNNRLPKPRSTTLGDVYPPGSGGMIPTKSEEKAKFLLAMQGEIERILKSIPGVQDAKVSVVVPEKNVIRDVDTPPPPATASVAIVYNPDKDGKKPVPEERIQSLVAAGVEGLKPQNVQVVMKENRPSPIVSSLTNGSGAIAPIAGESVMGVRVVDKKAGVRAKVIIYGFGGLAALGVVLGLVGIVRSVMLNAKLRKAEAETQALKKARRE